MFTGPIEAPCAIGPRGAGRSASRHADPLAAIAATASLDGGAATPGRVRLVDLRRRKSLARHHPLDIGAYPGTLVMAEGQHRQTEFGDPLHANRRSGCLHDCEFGSYVWNQTFGNSIREPTLAPGRVRRTHPAQGYPVARPESGRQEHSPGPQGPACFLRGTREAGLAGVAGVAQIALGPAGGGPHRPPPDGRTFRVARRGRRV